MWDLSIKDDGADQDGDILLFCTEAKSCAQSHHATNAKGLSQVIISKLLTEYFLHRVAEFKQMIPNE